MPGEAPRPALRAALPLHLGLRRAGHTVLAGDFVSIEDGTGVVHTGAAFGEDDFRLATDNGLTIHNPVLHVRRAHRPFAGMHVRDADAKIVEALRESGPAVPRRRVRALLPALLALRHAADLLRQDRAGTCAPPSAAQLLAANETIDWHPEHIKHGRFGKWLENNVDWALSRERYWGTPLPIWRCGEAHHVCVGSLEEIRELGGEPPEDVHRPYIDEVVLTCEECGGEMRRVPGSTSGGTRLHALRPVARAVRERGPVRGALPADYICEGLDQTRGWFYSLLAVSTLLFGRASYETASASA